MNVNDQLVIDIWKTIPVTERNDILQMCKDIDDLDKCKRDHVRTAGYIDLCLNVAQRRVVYYLVGLASEDKENLPAWAYM